jgi:hypothetical protein
LIHFEDVFFICSIQLSLGKSSRQRRNNVNMIRKTAYMYDVGTKVVADCGQIPCMRGRTSESSQGWRSLVLKMRCRMILLSDWGMAPMMIQLMPEVNRAFSAKIIWGHSNSWGVAPGWK